jgi:hypothetical protein
MNNSLRIQRDRLALEAMSGADIKALLTNSFPAFITEVKGFFNQFSPDQSGIRLTSRQNEFLHDLKKHNYLDIEALAAFTPEGLSVTYFEYSSELLIAAMHASRVLTGPLSAYSIFLSQLITNKDNRLSTLSSAKVHRELATAREDINKKLGACFKKGSTATDSTLGKVTERNSDWQHVFQNTENMLHLMNGVDRKALNKKVAECVELLDKVQDLIKNDQFEGVSPQAFESLSSGAYEIASELEFFAAIYYKVEAFSNALNRTTEHFYSVFKK